MCTRFYIEPETDEFQEIIEAAEQSLLAQRFVRAGHAVKTSGEIRPTDVVPVLAPGKDGKTAVFPMRWGFQIPGRAVLVNARVETASEKPTFRNAWEKHRCIIPASWYYEWEHIPAENGRQKTGRKYMLQPRNSVATWLTGLYRIEDGLPCFTVLTRDSVGELRRIHDRMPLILPEDRLEEWIDPSSNPEALVQHALSDLMMEKTG